MFENKFLDSKGVEVLWGLVKKEISDSKVTTVNTTAIWDKKESYIPTPGEVIVYSDYKTITDENGEVIKTIPAIKIGDGRTPVQDLEFISTNMAERVSHSLKIGDITYDGSKDVEIPTYSGDCI